MRKLLFESVFRQPLTERAPSPDDAAVAELARELGDFRIGERRHDHHRDEREQQPSCAGEGPCARPGPAS